MKVDLASSVHDWNVEREREREKERERERERDLDICYFPIHSSE